MAIKIGEDLTCSSENMIAGRQAHDTETVITIHRVTVA